MLTGQVTVDFTVDQQTGCGTVQSQFTDLSTSSAGNIIKWVWDLGAVQSSLMNPGRIFAEPGVYTICLTVTDATGNTANLCKEDYIEVFALPVPDFEATPVSGCTPLMVTFTDHSTSENGDILEWIWGLGGSAGVISVTSGETVTSTYTQSDNYSINLTIIDEKGCSETMAKDELIMASGLEPALLASSDTFSCDFPHSAAIQFLNPVPGIVYSWDFGNGMTYVGTDPPPVEYNALGIYNITVIAEDPGTGCRDTTVYADWIHVGLDIAVQISSDSVCSAKRLDFMDTSIIPGDSYIWEFGDGESSTSTAPFHRYQEPGCYSVTVTKVYQGCSRTIVLDECIEVLENPELNIVTDKLASCKAPASFEIEAITNAQTIRWTSDIFGVETGNVLQITIDSMGVFPFEVIARNTYGCRTEILDTLYVGDLELSLPFTLHDGCVPQTFVLNDSVNGAYDITNWEWTVHTSPPQVFNEKNPSVTIDESGRFDVSLIIETSEGCTDSMYVEDYLTAGFKPEVSFSAEPLVSCADSTIQFTNMSSAYANSWLWYFGDGGTSLLEQPTHEYQDTGLFTVILFASHNGCTTIDSIEDLVYITPPVAKFTYLLDCASDIIEVYNLSIGADSVQWDFISDEGIGTSNSIGEAEFDITNVDSFILILTAWNFQTGCIDTRHDTIKTSGIQAGFDVSAISGCAPLEVQIQNNSLNAFAYQWIAPGAKISDDTTAQPIITYNNPGVYPGVTLITRDLYGCKDTLTSDSILVGGPEPAFEILPPVACSQGIFQLSDSSQSFGIGLESWDWILGDSLLQLSGSSPSFSLDHHGSFPVSLTVTDSLGCTSEFIVDNALDVLPMALTFATDSVSCVGAGIVFKVIDGDARLNYAWDFGDGDSGAGIEVSHTFQQEGNYTVCVLLAPETGCDTLFCKDILIRDPLAGFSADPQFANCPPLLVQFENHSEGAISYLWDFGDASGASDLHEPAHVYTKPGVYDVTLIANLSDQCSDTLVLQEYIRLEGPDGDFEFFQDGNCPPVAVDFFGNSMDYYSYIWDFGDGMLDSTQAKAITDTSFHLYTEPGAYVPKLILIDTVNCLRSFVSPDTIFVLETVTAEITDDTTLCAGGTFELTASLNNEIPGLQYGWIFSNDTLCRECLTFPVQVDTSAAFRFFVLNPNTCVYSDSVIINVNSRPVIQVSGNIDSLLCAGNSLMLNAMADRPGSWAWNGPAGMSCLECPDPSLVPEDSGTLSVLFTDTLGCQVTDSFSYVLWEGSLDFVVPQRTICKGDTISVTLENVSQPIWEHAGFVLCDTCLQTEVFPPQSTNIPISGLDTYGCSVSDTLHVEVLASDAVEAGNDLVICLGESVTLSGIAPGELIWTGSGLIDDPQSPNPVVTPDGSVFYILQGTKDACTLFDSVFIEVIEKVQITAVGDSVCPGDTAVLQVSGNAEYYDWFDQEGNWLQADTTRHFEAWPIDHSVYHIIGTKGTCEDDTVTAEVTIYPGVTLELKDDLVNYPGEPLQLNANVTPPAIYSYHWAPASWLSCTECPTPEVVSDSSGYIHLQVINPETGCFANDSIMYRVLRECTEELVFIPNVFSPNNDGQNDVFRIYSQKHQEIISLDIFDRWGNLVFSTDDFSDYWSGSFEGKQLDPGVFAYILKIPCRVNGDTLTILGDITLVR